jgi:hypothetical protein
MNQFRIKTRIGQVAIVPGSNPQIDIPRQYDYESIMLRISANLQVTAAATAVRAEAPTQLVPRLELTSDGRNSHFNAPFWAISTGNIERRINNQSSGVIVPPTGVAAATYAVEATGIIDLCNIDGVRPKDSNLRTIGMQLFQLRLNFGNPGDCFVGGTVVFSGSPIVEVFAIQSVELPDKDGVVTKPGALKKVSYQEIALPASNQSLEIRLPAGNLIRRVAVRTEGSPTAGEPTNTILNNMKLESGQDVRFNLSGANVRALQRADYGLVANGIYVADFASQGSSLAALTECWDVRRQQEPKLVADVVGSANAKMQIVTTEFILAQ